MKISPLAGKPTPNNMPVDCSHAKAVACCISVIKKEVSEIIRKDESIQPSLNLRNHV